jgi:hypothetical protein
VEPAEALTAEAAAEILSASRLPPMFGFLSQCAIAARFTLLSTPRRGESCFVGN